MAHLFYDSVWLEAEVSLRDNITLVLGRSWHREEPHNFVHELRRRLLSRAEFRPLATPHKEQRRQMDRQRRREPSPLCVARLWAYSSSCDRTLKRYGEASFRARIGLLRSLTPFTRTQQPHAILYARSDTQRRRLLEADDHFGALKGFYGGGSASSSSPRRLIHWDRLWGGGHRPSVDEQIGLVRNADRIVTPHGVFPSVWSFFLQPKAIVYELTAACYYYTWLPAGLTRREPLRLRHVYLSWRLGDQAKARRYNQSLELVHPRTGERVAAWTSPWCCCRRVDTPGGDFDLKVPPAHVLEAMRSFEPARTKGVRVYRGSEY